MRLIIFTVIFTNLLVICWSNLCDKCSCSKTGEKSIIDCDGRLINDTEQMDLLLFFENTPPETLILSNNEINALTLERIKNIKGLKFLDLSHNYLDESDTIVFEDRPQLEELNLSYNKWRTFDIKMLVNVPLISALDISHNLIEYFTEISPTDLLNLRYLNLSFNSLSSLNATSFINLPLLKALDLSFNTIKSIEYQAFVQLNSLNSLILQNNLIKSFDFDFPKSLTRLLIGHNELASFPSNLSIDFLSIDNNQITRIDMNNTDTLRQLKYLNVSGNLLMSFIDIEFPKLKTLDISFNNFSKIPLTLSTQNLPSISTLVISGNPMRKLKFESKIKLRNLVVDNMKLLESIDEDSFGYLREYDKGCINISISMNKKLISFHENVLNNLGVCYLDLSNNALTRISQKMTGLLVKYGINLQGNPMICDCKSQWMLDDLIPKLYTLNPDLLVDLRCNEPKELFDIRMVHWYNWQGQVFCHGISSNKKENLRTLDGSETVLTVKQSPIIIESSRRMLLAIIGSAIALTIIVIVVLMISWRLSTKRRRGNRRF